MTITQITVQKISEDHFNIDYFKSETHGIEDERVEVVKFIDECVDTMLRFKNKMITTEVGNRDVLLFKISIEAGGSNE